MSFFDLFKKKEEPKPDERVITGEIRSITQQVAAKLAQVQFQDITGAITEEEMQNFRASVQDLRFRMERASVTRLDTTSVDQQLLFLAEDLPDAIRYGNKDTTQRILKALSYGVIHARKDLAEKDLANASTVLDKRLRRISMHRNIIDLSKKIDALRNSIKKQEDTLTSYEKNYEENRKALKKVCTERPDLVRELDSLGLGNNQLSAGAKGIDTARVKVIELKDSIENLSRQMETNKAAMEEDISTIRTLEIQMTQADALVDEQTLEEIRKLQEVFRKELLQLEKQIDAMEQINKDFTRSLDAIYSSPDMVDRIIRHAMEFDALEKWEEAKEAGIQEGIANAAQENEAQTNARLVNS